MAKYYRKDTEGYNRNYPGKVTFSAVSDSLRDGESNPDSAFVILEKSHAIPNFRVWGAGPGAIYQDLGVRSGRHPQGSPTLFDITSPVISGAGSNLSMRHTVPKLLALALNEGGSHTTHDSSLSPYSSPIVQRALTAGLIRPNPDNPTGEVTNYLGFHPQAMGHVEGSTDVHPADLLRAGETVRRVLGREPRSNKQKVVRSNKQIHGQLSLFQFGD